MIPPIEAHAVVACANTLGESPVWSAGEDALYWVDIRAPALHRLRPASGEHRSWPMPELCCGVVLARQGVVLALGTSLVHFDPETENRTPLVEVEPAALGNRLNEARCDRAGRLWIGTMRDYGAAVAGSLYRVEAGRPPRAVLKGVRIPNSLGWSPDDRTMYFADTGEDSIRRYAFDNDTGALGACTTLQAPGTVPGRPDGCAVDRAGCVWSARAGAGQVVRLFPDGSVSATIAVPATGVTSCTFGDPDLRTLYITTAAQKLSPEERARQPQAGHLFAAAVPVAGLPETPFAWPVASEHAGREG